MLSHETIDMDHRAKRNSDKEKYEKSKIWLLNSYLSKSKDTTVTVLARGNMAAFHQVKRQLKNITNIAKIVMVNTGLSTLMSFL